MRNKTCFILGSGRSLLRLTEEEKEFINNSEFVLAFNKYLIFSDLVGITPTHYMLGDDGVKADLMLHETVKRCKQLECDDLKFFLSSAYQPQTEAYKKRKQRLKNSRRLKGSPLKRWFCRHKDREDDEALAYAGHNAMYFDRYDWLEGGRWARSLDEKIFHYRGSLTGAINLANIFHPTYDIKLLGVDLDHHAYFFQKELEKDPIRWEIFLDRLMSHSEKHGTIVDYKGTGGIQDKLPYIIEQVRNTGGDLYCCNPKSYLVLNDIVPYAAICSEDQEG